MAKGNFLMNTVSGKLGSMVLYRAKGDQRSRTYVKTVSNPSTRAQLEQRTQLANLVSMYRVLKPIAGAAFENIASNQSAYNAFVSANLNKGTLVFLPKAQAQAGGCVAAPYQITKGTLPAILTTGLAPDAISSLSVGAATTISNLMVAELSALLVNNNVGIDYGMQLSYVSVIQSSAIGTNLPVCQLKNFEMTLSVDDTTAVSDLFPARALGVTGNHISHVADTVLGGYCWVLSKLENSAVKVSSQSLLITSSIILNQYTGNSANTRAGDSYGVGDSVFFSPLTRSTDNIVVGNPSVAHVETATGVDLVEAVGNGSFTLIGCKVSGNNLSGVTAANVYTSLNANPVTDSEIIAGAVVAAITNKTAVGMTLAGPVTGLYKRVAIVLDGAIVYNVVADVPYDPTA